jgi:hypothetical protein
MQSRTKASLFQLVGGTAIGIMVALLAMQAAVRSRTADGRQTQSAKRPAAETRTGSAALKQPLSLPPGAAAAFQDNSIDSADAPVHKWLTKEDVDRETRTAEPNRVMAPVAIPSFDTGSGAPEQDQALKQGFAQASPTYQSSTTSYYVYTTSPQIIPASGPTQLTTTVSGYPVATGSGLRAVDYPQQGPVPWTVGANGLLQNPCVDPPSCYGRAYSRDR